MNDRLEKGVLIVFEGIDGTGKSTQLELLADSLKQRGFSVVTTREPTEGVYGKKIRELYKKRNEVTPEEELQLFIEDRRDHVKNLILPSLQAKKVVLCDRYYLSTAAYQGVVGFDPLEIIEMNSFAPEPELALIFQAPPAISTGRITQNRGETLNDFEQVDYLTNVASYFDDLQFPYITRIDASGSIESIHARVVSEVETLLKTLQGQ